MLILLDDFKKPRYTSRIWCMFECYTAKRHQVPIDVTLPPICQTEFRRVLKVPGGFSTIIQALEDIDTQDAKASFPEDEERIKKLVNNTIGFAAVDETVKSALSRWLALAFE